MNAQRCNTSIPRLLASADFIIIIVLIGVGILFLPALKAAAPTTVFVKRDHAVLARYPLSQDVTFTIAGTNGPVEISIYKKKVSIIGAHCKNQTCVKTGEIQHSYQQILCVPNHIIVGFNSPTQETPVDAIIQ